MDNRKWLSGASGTAPSAPSSPSTGYPTGGNPTTNQPPTNPGPYWFHAIGEELRAVIVAGGQTPNQGTLTQLLTAMQAMFGQVLSSSGVPYGFKIGPLIVQFGTHTADVSGDNTTVSVTLPTAFPTAGLWSSVNTLNPSGDTTADGWVFVKSLSTTALQATLQAGSGASVVSHGFNWIAIGY